jgi:hypothetical protein
MRSEYVFAAAKEINNRFLLCRVISVSARNLQSGSRGSTESINQSLQLVAAAEVGHNCNDTSTTDLSHCLESFTPAPDDPNFRSPATQEPDANKLMS